MALSSEELERRRQFVTGSDVAAVMNLSPYANAADVYYSKTEGIEPETNDSMELGSYLERSVLDWAASKLGPLSGGGSWQVHENGIVAATLDDMTKFGDPVEAKTSGLVRYGAASLWGDEGTDQIPEYYLLQVQCQLLVTGAGRAFVPALIGGRGFAMFEVNANRDLQSIILATCEAFWKNNVQARVPPEDVTPDLEVVKRIRRKEGKSVPISAALVAAYEEINKQRLAVEKLEKEAKARLIASLGDAEIGTFQDADGRNRRFEFFESTRKAYMVSESKFRKIYIK